MAEVEHRSGIGHRAVAMSDAEQPAATCDLARRRVPGKVANAASARHAGSLDIS